MKKSVLCWLISSALSSVLFQHTVQAQDQSGVIQHSASGLCIAPMGDMINANSDTRISLQDKCQPAPEAEFHWLPDGSIQHVQSGLCVVPQNKDGQFSEGVVLSLQASCNSNLSRFSQSVSGALLHSVSQLCIQPKTATAAPKPHMQLVLKGSCTSSLAAFQPFVTRGTDSDTDGIPDSIDQCPATPPFTPVDGKGCPLDFNDDDFDGVINSFDTCPNTPPGVPIDFNNGCPLDLKDDDKDGVINTFDKCPKTPLRKRVDSNGCPVDFRDTDRDGVANSFDFCPGTALGARVDDFGCPLPPDADGDGVPDEFDICPETPPGTEIDFSTGCPLDINDDDNDGVINSSDLCPGTPPGTLVDFRGCPIPDEDGDGVSDDIDACPGTPPGIAVDFLGCPLDEDFDGVPDSLDQCPRTPVGLPVDGIGCPVETDEDQDGVPDNLDQCPGTGLGEQVNPQGCPADFVVEILGQTEISGITNAQLKINAGDLVTSASVGGLQMRVLPTIAVRIFAEAQDSVTVLSTNTRISGVLQVPVFFENAAGATSNVFPVAIDVRPLDTKSSLVIHDDATLNAVDFDLMTVFDLLTSGSGNGQSGAQLFRQLWDSQLSVSSIGSSIICTGQFNGFPIVCDRLEATFATALAEQDLLADMRSFRLLAAVNRMELHNNWQDCGEHRLVFGKIVNGRNFLIFEARLPNPTPGQPSGCAAAVDFWETMSELDPQTQAAERAARLRAFFIDGGVTGTPVFAAEHFMANTGQIRTNQFMQAPWLLRENKLAQTCDPACRITAHPVSVKENPFGELFNPNLPVSSPLATVAADFQAAFVQNIASLTTGNFVDLKIDVPDRFNNGQSHSDFPNLTENEFARHFGGNMSSNFGTQLLQQLQSVTDARGEPLTVDQVLARSTALTCGGCHQPGFFGLDAPGSIGAIRLPNDEIIDSWPGTLGFVHIDEGRNLSPAIEQVFLPVRLQAFVDIMAEVQAP